MRRVAIVGWGGAGKSEPARRMGAAPGPPVVHLDLHFWNAGWRETPEPEWEARQAEFVAGDARVADGNCGRTLDLRFAAGTALFPDGPAPVVLRMRHGRITILP